MQKLWACIKKEIILLLRDPIGLSILFIMPMVLIFVMTLIQDSAFSSMNEKGVPVVFVNEDKDSLGNMIEAGLRNNELCDLKDSIDGKPATIQSARLAVANGQFLVGVIIPKSATTKIRANVERLVQQSLRIDTDSSNAVTKDSVDIVILVDPATKQSVVSSITSNLREFISEVKTKIMFQSFSEQIAEVLPDTSGTPNNAYDESRIINYKEEYASANNNSIVPNSVQHNVPAWSIFAMFFIVVPISSSIMKEKNEGTAFRLHTMPSSFLLLINGKIIVYVLVCMLQLMLMLLVGILILPMLGLPVLSLGQSIPAILLLSAATAFAAVGFSVMIGTVSSTEHQSAILGSLSVLLLSALGGIWVPSYVMPEIMRNISAWSPLNWGLEGFYKLFLRGGDVVSILPHTAKLLLFFVLCMAIVSIANRYKRRI